jgi:hypothetical protein
MCRGLINEISTPTLTLTPISKTPIPDKLYCLELIPLLRKCIQTIYTRLCSTNQRLPLCSKACLLCYTCQCIGQIKITDKSGGKSAIYIAGNVCSKLIKKIHIRLIHYLYSMASSTVHTTDDKSESMRVSECIAIRKNLEKIGVMLTNSNRMQLTRHMNSYIKNAVASTFKLRLNDAMNVVVLLSNTRQSGVTLEQL